ncbi:MAG: IMPACT family protein [Lentisphaeraceae bacterium]|nr:IMPACT family protein [Lentisphaeraceae bacterium]
MFTLDEAGEYREEIKKSRFICYAQPVFSEEEANAFFMEKSDLSARHNCWAWKIGKDYRFNDDGEPSGTAGKPILNAIEYADLTNVAVLVVRWFGGIKLGTGGLCRAYGGSASSCLNAIEKSEIKQLKQFSIQVPFEYTNTIYQLIEKENLIKDKEEFVQLGLKLDLTVEEQFLDAILEKITELSRGQIVIKH